MLTVDQLQGSLTASAPDDLPEELRLHLPAAEQAAVRNLDRAKEASAGSLQALQKQLMEAQTPKVPMASKMIRLRHIAGEWSAAFAAKTACASGCSHCCNINVSVARSEARLIAKAIKRPLSEPTQQLDIYSVKDRNDYFDVPCTFLKAGKCSIYAHRPLACRTLVNMDDVDLLCRLVPGKTIPVPYLNTIELQGYMGYLTQMEQFADIREWFAADEVSDREALG